ncbi:MAG: restriction endonuclease [Planctomycetota bacterium]
MTTEKQGKALESLVANLEKALAKNPNVTVHSPMHLPDRTTGQLREHDVVLELKEEHHSLLIAIECRDRSRPVGVTQVEGFAAKCQDTGVNQGVIVSTSGFYNTARTKADHLSIRCLDIEEVDNFDWLLAPGICATTKHLLSNDWTFYPAEDGVVDSNEFEVISSDGNVVAMSVLTANAQKQLTLLLSEVTVPIEEGEKNVKFPGKGLFLRNTSTGKTVPVKFAIAKLRYSIKQELIPFKLVQYQAKDGEEKITDAAYADIKLGDKEAQVMVVYKYDEGGRVVLISKGNKNA